MSVERLPFAPLAAACSISSEHGRNTSTAVEFFERLTPDVLAPATAVGVRLRVSYRTALRWQSQGVPIYTADRLLTHIGVHPVEVWGADYFVHANSTPNATPGATARRARMRA